MNAAKSNPDPNRSTSSTSSAAPSVPPLTITRLFAAPRELVFRAWTEPEMLAQWSCPQGFTIIAGENDVRPGGHWQFSMRDPTGKSHSAGGVYRETRKPERLVFTHAWKDGHGYFGHESLVTVTLVERDGRTTMTFVQSGLKSIESVEGHRGGWAESFDKLGAHVQGVATTQSPRDGRHAMTQRSEETMINAPAREIMSTRDFDAPRDRVFAAFSDPKQLARWWGPRGFSSTIKQFDLKPGGAWELVMHGPDGTDYHNESVFLEVVAPQRVVFQHLEPVYRFQMTMDFAEHGGKARLVWRMRFQSPEEFAKVSRFIAEANQQNFDRLDEHLASLAAVADTTTSDREIVISRVFNAPRELLWKAWTDPAHTSNWWGPAGFRTTTHAHELKPGGSWRYVMHGPDGRDYENLMTYQEVVEPERLAYTMGGALDCEPVNFNVVVTFDKAGDHGERTKVTMRSVFPSRDARDFVIREVNAVEGGKQHLARLGEYLGTIKDAPAPAPAAPGSPFIITRVFKAPCDLVFKVWTERDHLIQWFGPKGTTMPACTLDLRVGGIFHYSMRMADGQEHWGKWVFREITAPRPSHQGQLVFVVSFADASGNTVRQPWDKGWPMEWLSTVTFAEHAGIGRGTVVTVEWVPINATASERAAFHAGRGSMEQGWSGTMDQLAEHLAKAGTRANP